MSRVLLPLLTARLVATGLLLLTVACERAASPTLASQARTGRVPELDAAPEFVGLAEKATAVAGVRDTTTAPCPTRLRVIGIETEMVLVRSDVVRRSPAPGAPLAVTFARAIYLPNGWTAPRDDSVTVDCQTLRRVERVRPGA